MNEQQSETSFLRHCLHYGEGAEHEALDARITQIQRDGRCVYRALWLTAMLTALAAAVLGYGVVFVDNFPYNMPHFIVNAAFALGAGSLISFLAFMVLGMAYRQELAERREESRLLLRRLLDSRLGKPVTPFRRESRVADDNRETVPVPA